MIERVDTFSRNAAGKLIINPRKLDVQSFWLTPDAPNNPVVLGALANSGPIASTINQDGPFEGFYLTHERLNPTLVFVDIYDEGAKLRLVNRQVNIDTIFGRRVNGAGPIEAGILPHLFAETLWIHATRSLIFTFVDGAAGNTIWPIVTGRRFYNYANPSEELAIAIEKRTARARLSSPFWLVPENNDVVIAGGGGNALAFIRVPSVGHFEWHKLMSVSTGAYAFRLFDARNGRAVTNDWIHVNAGTGAGPLPLVLPEPTVFQPNSQLRVEFVDLSAAPNTIYFTLAGRMIYVG